MGIRYRLRQGFGRLGAQLCPHRLDLAWARARLPDPLWRLFAAMPRGDQWHGLCVARRLAGEGWQDADLLAAGLLHDAGKAAGGLTLAHRTLIILVRWSGADWIERLASSDRGWRRPFYVHRHHAALGAERLRVAGASEALIALVRAHEGRAEPPAGHLAAQLQALIAADDVC